jgi:feruloyl esterase
MAIVLKRLLCATAACAAMLLGGAAALAQGQDQAAAAASSPASASACAALAQGALWPDPTTKIDSAILRPAQGSRAPAHCEVIGHLQARTGVDGQGYAVGFHLRLPLDWNGRFLFQGGGGSNGVLGDAMGAVPFFGGQVALAQGYAVVSQDSGHDNQRNALAEHGGELSFGFDPIARLNYGHASLKLTTDAAKAGVRAFYGRAPVRSYFAGCSKGGQEGMALAQRYPDAFDGVLAGAPGFSLPRAALAEAWSTQTFGRLVANPAPSVRDLVGTFSDTDLGLVQKAVLAACDRADGLADGVVGAFEACSTAKVRPRLKRVTCSGAKADGCLTSAQVGAMLRVFAGPKTKAGAALYSDWPWDGGLAAPGWRLWTLGLTQPPLPAFNVSLGMGSLAAVFSTPPRGLPDDKAKMAFAMAYDFDRDAAKIYAVAPPFTRSAWEDNAARSSDLAAFKARGGRLIVPHGASDAVFSINDTLAWYREVDARFDGRAAEFVRVFPVPGMNHCMGGPATDQFDAFTALVAWVEQGQAPDRILATAGRDAPWPGRTRPLCAYPAIAVYSGRGDPERAESFSCRRGGPGKGPPNKRSS